MMSEDLQSQTDKRNIPIEKVGISDFFMPIYLQRGKNKKIPSVGKFSLAIELDGKIRGAHMSRFFEIIQKYESTIIDEIVIKNILNEIRVGLNSRSAFLSVEFKYFINKKPPISSQTSIMNYPCKAIASINSINDYSFTLEICVPVNSVCPCSMQISDDGAHNQRGFVSVSMNNVQFINIIKIINIIEKNSGSGEVYTLLKRPDEKHLTENMFRNPKFIEDIIRDTKISLSNKGYHTNMIRCLNYESIHNHNVFAIITDNPKDER